jgi:hypothetical protein
MALSSTSAQHGTREITDGFGSPEEPRVTGGAAERPTVLIVYFAHQHAASPEIVFGRRGHRSEARRRIEQQWLARHLLQQIVGLLLEGTSTCVFDEEPEQHEAEVAVNGFGVRCGLKRKRADRVLKLGAARMIAIEGEPCREARAVRQQRPQRDRFTVVPTPVRNPRADAIAQR